jgi:FkbM family methyltransferase
MLNLKDRVLNKFKRTFTDIYKRETYSQMGEDLIIASIFDSIKIDNPTWMDIGAHDPSHRNNTYLLYKKGCRGINIEPNPKLYNELVRKRPKDINLNLGISKYDGTMNYFELDQDILNTFDEEEANRCVGLGHKIIRETPVTVKTIDTVLKQLQIEFPTLLSLDCEGLEEVILQSHDFTTTYPQVICLETVQFGKYISPDRKKMDLINYVISMDYLLFADTYINSIFIHNSLI